MSKTTITSEIRKAYLLNKYVIITPSRASRPRDIKEETVIKRSAACPFCPENIDKNNVVDSIGSPEKWDVLCIKNIFPAVSLDNSKAYGQQEVILETRHHSKELASLSLSQIEKVLRMYGQRTAAICQNKKIDYVLCFKNQGSKAGASIVHAHSQVFATQVIPPDIEQELQLASTYRTEHQSCAYCDIIKQEIKTERKIFEDEHIAVIAPYASEYHYEAWLFTKRHLDNISLLSAAEYQSFARAYKLILSKLQALDLSFNCFLHQVVSNQDQHFYMKIQPRDSIWAGVELGSGMVINSVPPEEAAAYYRND